MTEMDNCLADDPSKEEETLCANEKSHEGTASCGRDQHTRERSPPCDYFPHLNPSTPSASEIF